MLDVGAGHRPRRARPRARRPRVDALDRDPELLAALRDARRRPDRRHRRRRRRRLRRSASGLRARRRADADDPAAPAPPPARLLRAPRGAPSRPAGSSRSRIADALEAFERGRSQLPPPDVGEVDGWRYAVPAGRGPRRGATGMRIERVRATRRAGRRADRRARRHRPRPRRAPTSCAAEGAAAGLAPARRARRSPRPTSTSAPRWCCCVAERTLRVCALYPDLMNIYADRGNLLLLERRCAWRGHRLRAAGAGLGERARPRRARPLLHRRRPGPRPGAVRAGPGRDQARRAARRGRRAARSSSRVCGGYQLLGHGYELGDERAPRRRARRPRDGARGRPAADRQRRDRGRAAGPTADASWPASRTTAAARTWAPASDAARPRAARATATRPLGLRGRPRRPDGTVIGTYLHGPLLPKNAWFADWLTATALGVEPAELAAARRRARGRRARRRAPGRGV